TSSCKSTAEVCALGFFVQQVNASSVAAAQKTTAAGAKDVRRKLIREGPDGIRTGIRLLFSHNQHFELPCLSRGKIKALLGRVERHGSCARGGPDRLHRRVLIRRILVNHVHRSIAVREEDESFFGIKRGGIYVIADRQSLDHLPGFRIYNRRNL